MDSILVFFQNLWVIVCNGLLLILVVDYFLHWLLSLPYFRLKTYSSLDGTLLSHRPVIPESYQDKQSGWFNAYIDEAKWVFNHIQWRSYTYWASEQFKGEYINLNHAGIRKTVRDGASAGEEMVIYIFGGSTVWGWGARDAYTIPSCVSQRLQKHFGIVAKVVNFGELGYVSTQELICLIRELQQQRKPNIVVTYDGLNDSFVSYQLRRAGLSQNEPNREREFNQSLSTHLNNFLHKKSGFYKLKNRLSACRSSAIGSINKYEMSKLAADTAVTYFNNIKILNAIGLAYDFKVLAYWQPVLFDKNILTTTEKEMRDKQLFWHDFYLRVKQEVQQKKETQNFYCLSDIFSNYPGPAFIDPWHVDEKANQYIAERIADDIHELLKSSGCKIKNQGSSVSHNRSFARDTVCD